MEYTIGYYRRQIGKVLTTTDGHKYLQCKVKENKTYLKCVLFRDGCKATAKLQMDTNLILPIAIYNHSLAEYKSKEHELKSKCKTKARNSQDSLRRIFDDITRDDPAGSSVSFPQCESAMYRSRRISQPKIPTNAIEFSEIVSTTTFGKFYRSTVSVDYKTAIIFFSDKLKTNLPQIRSIQFDGTFQTVPVQFFQLWTIFITVGRYTLPGIHCLMTAKDQNLYKAILNNIRKLIPQFQPEVTMSDWEIAPRNAVKEIYPNVKNYGCWFHFSQRVWQKTQKLGLVETFTKNKEFATYVRCLMAIPFLPSDLIQETYNLLKSPGLPVANKIQLENLKKYFRKRWLSQISAEELSIFESDITTNNGAESYHAKLKGKIICSHPRIWSFMSILNEIISDTDNEIERICLGMEISRQRKRKNVINDERRAICKDKLTTGIYTPLEYLEAISDTIGKVNAVATEYSDISEESEEEEELSANELNICAVCLNPRTTTWIFLPCRHANCCTTCSRQVLDLGLSCPVCRSPIENSFQIYTS